MIKTDGNWNENSHNLYFTVNIPPKLADTYTNLKNPILYALNNLSNQVLSFINKQEKREILIDSGVFSLVTETSRKFGTDIVDTFTMPPEEVPNFDKFYKRYVERIGLIKNKAWGYIEIDLGGIEGKERTRKKLQQDNFNPIPVYHFLSDPYDYFIDLANRYDRVSIGNLAFATNYQRSRVLAKVMEHKLATGKPKWIHALGMAPSDLLYTYPVDSCDSSGWTQGARYGRFIVTAGAEPLGKLSKQFVYHRDLDNTDKTIALGIYNALYDQENWNIYTKELK
jgi:hypothetical protein